MSQPAGTPARSAEEPTPKFSGWTRALLASAVVLMLAGSGLWMFDLLRPTADATAGSTGSVDPALVQGFAPSGAESTGSPSEEPTSTLTEWSPALFRLGFSFAVAFAIAYALRAFLRVAIVVAGLALLLLFGLQYAGVIDVDWSSMSTRFDGARDWLGEQTATFATFIKGYLPSTASAGLGFWRGFKR